MVHRYIYYIMTNPQPERIWQPYGGSCQNGIGCRFISLSFSYQIPHENYRHLIELIPPCVAAVKGGPTGY